MASKAAEYNSLIAKLLEKTQSGRLDWKEGSLGSYVVTGSEGDFRADLEEGFSFYVRKLISRGDTTYALRMSDPDGRMVFELNLTDDPDTMFDDSEAYNALGEIYELARRKALRVDEKIERVSGILERI